MNTTELTSQLRQERFALSSLLEFMRILTPDMGAEGILRSVVRTVMGKSLIMDSFSYLRIAARDDSAPTYALISRSGFRGETIAETLSQSDFDKLIGDSSRAISLLPIITPDDTEFLGILGFGKSINPGLRVETEATYLASLAALTSIALTNARLFERERERERYESELRLAREIQETLFPQAPPEIKQLEFAAVTRPSEWIGGDYYDLIQLGPNSVLFAVADVVGKGITAALTMSNLQAALRALVSLVRTRQLDLLAVVMELNRLMCESTAPERFITAVFGIIDTQTMRVECAVCGHPNPLIVSRNACREIASSGIPLGIIPGYQFTTNTYDLESGDVVLAYTDGFSEAKYNGQMIGVQGIEHVVDRLDLATSDLQSGLDRIIASTELTVEDDITIVAIRFLAGPTTMTFGAE